MTETEKKELLQKLAEGAVERLKALPPPVVRVCGPLTSGGYGYDENRRRFKLAKEALRQRGKTVFDYFDSSDDEEKIKTANIEWKLVMDHYHDPILRANLLEAAYFMPGWQESNGTCWEHAFIEENTTTKVVELREEWIAEQNNKGA